MTETPSAEDYIALMPIVADRGWRVVDRFIRDRMGRCPLCALLHELSDGDVDWNVIARMALSDFGLPYVGEGVDGILGAADYPDHPLRPALMQALRMKP